MVPCRFRETDMVGTLVCNFSMLYNGASKGNNFVEGNELVADQEAGVATLQFLKDLSDNDLLLTREATDPFETGQSIMVDIGPWTFSAWAEKYPEMKLGETSEHFTMPPVPEGVDSENEKTFADTKGLSIYASATKEQAAGCL